MQAIESNSSAYSARVMPWIVCLSSAMFFFYEFIQGNMFASINREVMLSFNTDILGCSYLSSMYYLANVIFLFPAGIILDRYSTKKVVLAALLLCVVGTLLFAFASSYALGLFSRFITGIGSAFCFLSCIRLASRWFSPHRMALVTGIVVTFAMTGGMVAQEPLTHLVLAVGWRQAVFYDGLLGILVAVIIYMFVEDTPYEDSAEFTSGPKEAPQPFWCLLKAAYGNSQNILAGVYTSLMNMPVAILGAFIGSVYLMQSHHYLRAEAASINSMIFLGTIVGGPLLGYLSDIVRSRKVPMVVCNVASMFVVILILYMPSLTVIQMKILFAALGFFSSAQVISYPLVAENNRLTMTATSVSVVSVLTQGGFILYQNLFSYVLHHKETVGPMVAPTDIAYRHALMLIPYGFILALISVLLLRETHCRRIEEQA